MSVNTFWWTENTLRSHERENELFTASGKRIQRVRECGHVKLLELTAETHMAEGNVYWLLFRLYRGCHGSGVTKKGANPSGFLVR